MADTTANQISAFKDVQRKLCRNYYLMSVVEFDGETITDAAIASKDLSQMLTLQATISSCVISMVRTPRQRLSRLL